MKSFTKTYCWFYLSKNRHLLQSKQSYSFSHLDPLVGRITRSPKCSHPNPWNPWMYYFAWQRDFADIIEGSSSTGKIILDYPGRPNLIRALRESYPAAIREGCDYGKVREMQQYWLWRPKEGGRKGKKGNLLESLQERCNPADSLILA